MFHERADEEIDDEQYEEALANLKAIYDQDFKKIPVNHKEVKTL